MLENAVRMPWKNVGSQTSGLLLFSKMEISGEFHFFLDVVYSHNVTITVVESPSMVRRKVVFMAAPVLLPLRLFGPGLSPADGMTLPASKNR